MLHRRAMIRLLNIVIITYKPAPAALIGARKQGGTGVLTFPFTRYSQFVLVPEATVDFTGEKDIGTNLLRA